MSIYILYKWKTIKKKKRGHEFERDEGGFYGSVWREERKGGNDIISYNIQNKRNF